MVFLFPKFVHCQYNCILFVTLTMSVENTLLDCGQVDLVRELADFTCVLVALLPITHLVKSVGLKCEI